MSTPDPLYVLRAHTSGVQSIKYYGSDHLLSGSLDGKVNLWKLATRRPVVDFSAHNIEAGHGILKVDSLGPGHDIVTQGRDGLIHFWNVEHMKTTRMQQSENSSDVQVPSRSIFTGARHFCQFALPRWPDSTEGVSNTLLAPCDVQSRLQLWDVREPNPGANFDPVDPNKSGMVMCCRLLDTSEHTCVPLVVAGYEDGSVCVYDMRSCVPLVREKLHSEPVLSCEIGINCVTGVSGSADSDIYIWELNTSAGKLTITEKFTLQQPGVSAVEVRPDQKLFASGGWDSNVRLFRVKKPVPLAVLSCHDETVTSLSFCPVPGSGSFCAGSKDGRISVWSLFGD